MRVALALAGTSVLAERGTLTFVWDGSAPTLGGAGDRIQFMDG